VKLVRPGAEASRTIPLSTDAARRVRLGRAAGALLAAGWLLSLALTVVVGPRPDSSGTMLALAGAAIGAILSQRRWDRQPERSLRLLVAVCAMHAAAGMIALDPSADVSFPLFAAVAVIIGLIAPTRPAVLVCAAALGGIALFIAALGPARGPDAVANAVVMAPALMVVASLTAGARAYGRARAVRAARPVKGDPSLVHASLVGRAQRDPDRFAALAMDIDLQEGRGLSVAEGNRLLADIADALISRERERMVARRRATELLVERVERTVANIELEELGWFNFEQAYTQPLDEGTEAAALIRRADEALREARERRGRRPIPVDADIAVIAESQRSS
jgi:hypothetical protein